MKTSRRAFLASAALATGSAAGLPLPAIAAESPRRSPVQLGIASYSYWHFRDPKVTIEQVVEKTAALGVAGVDVLHRQMDLPEKEPLTAEHRGYLARLRRHAARHGVAYCCLSIHQNFVSPDPAYLKTQVEHTKKCIEIAYALGASIVRINSGRWNTIKDFNDLMKARGIEPRLPGYTDDDAFKWCAECITQCLPKAEECGVTLAVENHWGLTRTPEGLLRLSKEIQSPWFGVLLDTGNFLENPYDKITQVASKAVYVQAKTYYGGGEWYTLDLDYPRIAKILSDAGYTGWISLEMEGKENPDLAVPKSIKQLRKAFGV